MNSKSRPIIRVVSCFKMKIIQQNLLQWAKDSIVQAIKLGLDENVLTGILAKTRFTILSGLPSNGLWYGRALYSEPPEIQIYEQNMTTESLAYTQSQLSSKKVPQNIAAPLLSAIRLIPQGIFFELINQSGMDHELIGHIYNYQARLAYDEQAACETQIKLAEARGGIFKPHWKVIAALAPIILSYHKKDAFVPRES